MRFRLSIDWDGEGAFAVITRPGQSAEMILLPDHDRLATKAMTAALAIRGRLVVTPARWPKGDKIEGITDAFDRALRRIAKVTFILSRNPRL